MIYEKVNADTFIEKVESRKTLSLKQLEDELKSSIANNDEVDRLEKLKDKLIGNELYMYIVLPPKMDTEDLDSKIKMLKEL